MPNRRTIAILVLLLLAVSLLAWRLMPGPAAPARSPGQAPTPRRVITFSPALTEIVYAIGAGNTLVGVADFSDYPPEAKRLPHCGAQINPNFERLAALKPDLIILQGEIESVRRYCEANNLRYWSHKLDSLADEAEVMRELGNLLGRPTEGEATAARLERELAAVRASVAGQPPVPVFVCVGRQPGRIAGLTTCGPGSFLDEVVRTAGGRNVFDDVKLLYPQPSIESLSARKPEVVLDLQPDRPDTPEERRKLASEWQALSLLPAVKQHRVEVVTRPDVLIPGPRIPSVARELARRMHPGLR